MSEISDSSLESGLSRAELVSTKLRPRSKLARCVVVEMFCTGFMLFCGFNVSTAFLLSNSLDSTGHALGWGMAAMVGIMMGYNVSGGHANPAVSLSAYALGKLSFLHFVFYSAAQTVGAFGASALVFFQYHDLISASDVEKPLMLGINVTSAPGVAPEGVPALRAAIGQVLFSAVMCMMLVVVAEPANKAPRWVHPPLFGLAVCFMSLGFSLNGGCAMNPARAVGSRVFSILLGYRWEVFSYRSHTWFWVPILAPLLGAILGTGLYIVTIKPNFNDPTNASEVCSKKERALSENPVSTDVYTVSLSPVYES